MEASGREMLGLIREHEAIRAYMKFLAASLSGLAEPDRPVKERLWSYRWWLYDFRDAIKQHIELDDRIFGTILGSPVEDSLWEHDSIRQQVDDIIRLSETVVEEREEAKLCKQASEIAGAFNKVCQLIIAHIAKEDKLLGQVQKDFWPGEENSRG